MQSPPERFVSFDEFCRRSSLSRATIYRLIDAGSVPRPVRLTDNRVAWPVEVVDEWMGARVAQAVAQ